jgi:hypothetical protein
MLELANRPKLGPYILTRELQPCTAFGSGSVAMGFSAAANNTHIPQRFLALHSATHTSHVAYRFPMVNSGADERRFHAAAEAATLVRHSHILPIEQSGIDALGHPWIIAPFTGDVDGIRTLSRLLKEKGGQMRPLEVERAMDQLLRALAAAHDLQTSDTGSSDSGSQRIAAMHGPIGMDEVLVDRHGALTVELYGFARAMRGLNRGNPELVRDEVRSVVEIAYQLITGLRAEEPIIPADRLVPQLDQSWSTWLSKGLDPMCGFDSAMQALLLLPSPTTSGQRSQTSRGVRGVLSRLRASREA